MESTMESTLSKEAALRAAVSAVSRSVLEPLSEATNQLITPIRLAPKDMLRVSLSADARFFECQAFCYSTWGQQPGEAPRMQAASGNASTAFFKRIPERKELGYGRWLVAATDFTSLVILHSWPSDRVEWSPEAKLIHTSNLLRFLDATRSAHMRALFKLRGVVPKLPSDFDEHPDPSRRLTDYQRVALVSMLDASDGFSLFMEQGTGKTPVVIAYVSLMGKRTLAEEGRARRVLVVAPKNVRMNWVYECRKFATSPGRVTVLRGGELTRMKLLVDAMDVNGDDAFTVVICSYEAVERSWDAISICEWDDIVLDESHYIKSTHTKRFSRMMKLRDCGKRRFNLTGTPVLNTLLDLYPQFEFMGDGWSGFNSWRNFRAFHARFKSTEQGYEKLIGYKNVPLLQERLARAAFLITCDEAKMKLPEKVYDVREVLMTPEQRRVYLEVRDRLAATISLEGKNEMLTVQHVLTQLLRLAQVTSGHMAVDAYTDDGAPCGTRTVDIPGGNPKIDAVIEDVSRDLGPKEKAIIWCNWVHDIRAISRRLTAAGIEHRTYYGGTSERDREEAVLSFNSDPRVRVFVANAAAGGVGLNLLGYPPGSDGKPEDPGTNVTLVSYFSQGWSLAHRLQSEKRAHRFGTRVPVRFRDYVVPGTIDEEIRTRVTEKAIDAMNVQDIREVLARILSQGLEGGDE